MNRANAGQIRIIEAVLALLIVFSAFTLSADLTATETSSRHSELASVGLQCLTAMDSSSSLIGDIETADWTRLRDSFVLALPSGMIFNLTIFGENEQQINTEEISNGSFNNQEVTVIEYLCVSTNSTFRYYVLRLQLSVIT